MPESGSEGQQQPATVSITDFFEKVSPGRRVTIKGLASGRSSHTGTLYVLNLPAAIELHCDTESCGGVRLFEPTDREHWIQGNSLNLLFIVFKCRNCANSLKIYAIWLPSWKPAANEGIIEKLGELPAFGPQTPSRLISLVGPERDYYLKGRRAENQGLGIAAFAYYRRVVENQRNRIFDEIIRVSETIGVGQETIGELKAAKSETQFTRSVEAVKSGIPQLLLINGHNPLTLLHSAISEGLHADTDEECLEIATSIRVVLTELADRLATALKDHAELKTAVSRLLAKKPKP
jgi:hypothetical protein